LLKSNHCFEYGSQHNNTQHNDSQHNGIQHNSK
jgi:hypothetical protein